MEILQNCFTFCMQRLNLLRILLLQIQVMQYTEWLFEYVTTQFQPLQLTYVRVFTKCQNKVNAEIIEKQYLINTVISYTFQFFELEKYALPFPYLWIIYLILKRADLQSSS